VEAPDYGCLSAVWAAELNEIIGNFLVACAANLHFSVNSKKLDFKIFLSDRI
jgi:hypothetical protein